MLQPGSVRFAGGMGATLRQPIARKKRVRNHQNVAGAAMRPRECARLSRVAARESGAPNVICTLEFMMENAAFGNECPSRHLTRRLTWRTYILPFVEKLNILTWICQKSTRLTDGI